MSGFLGGPPNSLSKVAIRHGQADTVIEILHIEMERSIRLNVDQVVSNVLGI
jgi:hypothetical protein